VPSLQKIEKLKHTLAQDEKFVYVLHVCQTLEITLALPTQLPYEPISKSRSFDKHVHSNSLTSLQSNAVGLI
jgi:hypothetical protein